MSVAAAAFPYPTSPEQGSSAGTVGVLAAAAAEQPQVEATPAGVPPVPGAVTGLVAHRIAFSALHGPGRRHVLFLQGCQFDCLACANPELMPRRPRGLDARTVEDVLAEIRQDAPYLDGVTVSGGEPTAQPEFLHALLGELARGRGTSRLTRFVATNADAPAEVWDKLAPVTDGFLVDLKALDDDRHVVLTGRSNRRVLASIHDLAARGLLYEVRLLLIPGLNDSDVELRRTADWLLAVDPRIRLRVVEFGKRGTRVCARDLTEPRRRDFVRYWQVLSSAGVDDLVVP